MLTALQVESIAKALQMDKYNNDPFEFNGSVNEYLLEVLKSIEVKEDYILYTIDDQVKTVRKELLEFEIHYDHVKLNIGKHQIGRKNKKRTYYAFMYSGTDTKRFVEELMDHIRKVDIIVMITEAPAPTPFPSPSSVPATPASSCIVS